MRHYFNIISSTFASSCRSWRGTSASKTVQQPKETLILFDQEGDPECRLAREALTELNLDVMIAPCPEGGNNIRNLKRDSGSDKLPLLVDNNTQRKCRGSDVIVEYLYEHYRQSRPPKQLLQASRNRIMSTLASLARLNAGTKARQSISPEHPLTLYAFESSPFSRLVRELLCELELPYFLVNLGKQQWSDMGPAKPRFVIGPYKPLANTKRDAFFKEHGNVQVPYLVDPNTGEALFESKKILDYLATTYRIKTGEN